MLDTGYEKTTFLVIQVDESDVGSDRFQCWILSEPMLDHMGSDNPIGSYWIPGDEIRSEVVGGGSDGSKRSFSSIAKTIARKICNI